MPLIVYSTPSCMPCKIAKRQLDAAGIPYSSVDVTEDAHAAELLRAKGFMVSPVFRWRDHYLTMADLPEIIREEKAAA